MRCGIVLPFFDAPDVASCAELAATLDRLSGGRVQLSVGLGALHPGWTAFERGTSRAERASLLDEGPAVYDGLMRGRPFSCTGRRYEVLETGFFPPPPPVQRPRVPVWVVGAHGRPVSMRRAVAWDGLLPDLITDGARGPSNPVEPAAVVAEAREPRTSLGLPWDGYDVIAEGTATNVREWGDAGATWWVEADWETTVDAVRDRIAAGPPATS